MIMPLNFNNFFENPNDYQIFKIFESDYFIKYNKKLVPNVMKKLYFDFFNKIISADIFNFVTSYVIVFRRFLIDKKLLEEKYSMGFDYIFYNYCGITSDMDWDIIESKTNKIFLEPILKEYPEFFIKGN